MLLGWSVRLVPRAWSSWTPCSTRKMVRPLGYACHNVDKRPIRLPHGNTRKTARPKDCFSRSAGRRPLLVLPPVRVHVVVGVRRHLLVGELLLLP